MLRLRHFGLLAGLLMGSAAVSGPASAFSIFGFHLWGAPEENNRVEIIDPLPYDVDFHVIDGAGRLTDTLRTASALWQNKDEPASGRSGLISRAKGDYRRLLAALYNAGYYGGEISITLAGREAADLTLAATFPDTVPVVVTVQPGPIFTFGDLRFVNPAPPLDMRRRSGPTMDSIGFQPGMEARAATIGKASDLAVEHWRIQAHAKAHETGRDVVADHATGRVNATIALDPGRAAHYGPTTVKGNNRTDSDFIAFMADLPEGQAFSSEDVERGRLRLNRLGIFRSLRIIEAPDIAADGSLPMTIEVEDRRPRTMGFGGTLSTIDGVGLEAYWLHRNLFGQGERLRFDAKVAGLGRVADTVSDDLDYSFGVTFTKPGVYRPDTNAIAGALALQSDFETYFERSVSIWGGFSQQFGDRLTGDLTANYSRSHFRDIYGRRDFETFALIGNLTYDVRNDPLDATRGYFVSGMIQPFYEANYDNAALLSTVEGRYFKSVAGTSDVGLDRLVMAGRLKLGSFYGPTASQAPPNLLFFAGGGGSVRGYAYRSLGIEAPGFDDGTFGGRGLVESSVEARYRVNERFGAVGFVDSGFVTEDPKLSGSTDLRFGVGLGMRYYTPIGPLRVDLATPVNPRPSDNFVALYIGIGQAF